MTQTKEVRVYAPPTLVEDVDEYQEAEGLSSHSAAWKELARRQLRDRELERQALSHIKQAQEHRKRRDFDGLETNLDAAERLIERIQSGAERELRTDGGRSSKIVDERLKHRKGETTTCCPVCGNSKIHERKTMEPRWRCPSGHEFDEPDERPVNVNRRMNNRPPEERV